jgi:hypothetical protein
LGSARQQDAEKQGSQREGAGHGAEDRKPGGAARAGVREDCDTRHQYRSEVGDQRRPVTSGDLVLLGGDVPDAGGYQNGKGGLGDLVEPAGRSTRHLGSGRRSTGASAASVSWPPNQMVAVQDSLSVSELTVSILRPSLPPGHRGRDVAHDGGA